MALNRKIAYIDLDKGEIGITPVLTDDRRKFLGGRGLGTHLFCRHTPKGCDPRGPDNTVVISTGLLVGTPACLFPATGITVKSPLAGLLEHVFIEGAYALEMRFAGFDHLVVSGRAPRPSTSLCRTGK